MEDYRKIASSVREHAEYFMPDKCRILDYTTNRVAGGRMETSYVDRGIDFPCRVTSGRAVEGMIGDKPVVTLLTNIHLPAGTPIKQDARIVVENTETGEKRVFQVQGIQFKSYEVRRSVTAEEIASSG